MNFRANAILDALPSAVLYTDDQARILECNRRACAWFGYSRDELQGRSLLRLLSILPTDLETLDDVPPVWLHKGGKAFRAEVARYPVADESPGILWLLTDPAEHEAERAEAARLLLESRELERLRLARELHDGVIQDLIAIGFGLAALEPEPGPALEQDAVHRQRLAVMSVVRQLRSIVRGLRPAGLEEFGLDAAVEGLLAKLLADHVGPVPQLDVQLDNLPELSLPVQLCVYRATQEAVNNSLRHSQASHISVRLQRAGLMTELRIEDDGCGFEVPASLQELTHNQRYGLAGIAERVRLVGGSLSLDSGAGRGTTVRLLIPARKPD